MFVQQLAVVVLLCVLVGTNADAHDDSYLDVSALDSVCVAALRVSEQQLVEGPSAWPHRTAVLFAPVATVKAAITALGQDAVADAECYMIATCAMADNLWVHVVVADVDGTDINRSVYIVTARDAAIVSSARYAWLTTSCQETTLGLPTIADDGRLHVRALRHRFDCDTDAFLATEQQEGKQVTLMLDGNLRQTTNSSK